MAKNKRNEIQDRYMLKYMRKVGTAPGFKEPMSITMLSASWNCSADYAAEYGCKPGERALMVGIVPAGMTYAQPKDRISFPEEAGVDEKQLPPKEEWVEFPATFEGLPVYYKRGSQAWAL